MARPLPPEMIAQRGTGRRDRPRILVFESKDPQPPERPKWLTGEGRKLWERKVAVFKARRIDVADSADLLASLCTLEAFIERRYRLGREIPASWYATQISLSREFFLTPGSRVLSLKPTKPNKFAQFKK